jgi:hypothetical protein
MKTIKFIAILAFVPCLMLVSCKSKKTTDSSATKEVSAPGELKATKGKYGIKSGIVEYKTQMMGMDMIQTLSFDDYGKKEITDMEMEMMGTKIHSVTLRKDGFIYTYDLVKKTGTKTAALDLSSQNIDFENLSEELVKDMNLKKEGTEDFLGKTCEKISIDYTKMQMKGTYLVWKGIALKMNSGLGATKMDLTAQKLEENPTFPADKFEVPADVKITEK